ncbi:Type I restriction modification DNA specificity domain protein [Oceanobacillus oncorhynchi]|uniref:Type I restriction modification DNA specificity domain protein n=1 Tax=Oceanobacillus oncorhynchi TaxID=545501 RepID=A0A0A1MBG4_9BACI|nr:restriction endonuclease subunit S [Oceanobacillus oncorhynchi]CEI80373.1 Type I restriction modification DNA specificity domain protein [Oceanobacillus oncorhynchi]
MIFREASLETILEINPRLSLKKGLVSKKVAMEHIDEYVKKIQGYELTEFKNGSKFQNGDTLVARITPCLENGKTAYVDILEDNEIAFGSTEFFVIRAKEGRGDSQFVYYLMRHPNIRKVIIQSMTGTSGRQRAQKQSILEYNMSLPDLDYQKKIGRTLSLYDAKIESNKEIINTLEQLSQTLFKHWFIDFEFPNEQGQPYKSSGGEMVESELGEIPKGWRVYKLNELTELFKLTFNPEKTTEEKISHFSLPAFDNGQTPTIDEVSGIKSNKWILKDNCVVFSKMNPRTPRIWLTNIVENYLNVASSEFVVLKSETRNLNAFIYNLCKSDKFNEYLISNATGSTNSRQRVTPTIALDYKIALDMEQVELYSLKVVDMVEKIKVLRTENKKLSQLRDNLLPKLLSGEVEISEALEV